MGSDASMQAVSRDKRRFCEKSVFFDFLAVSFRFFIIIIKYTILLYLVQERRRRPDDDDDDDSTRWFSESPERSFAAKRLIPSLIAAKSYRINVMQKELGRKCDFCEKYGFFMKKMIVAVPRLQIIIIFEVFFEHNSMSF